MISNTNNLISDLDLQKYCLGPVSAFWQSYFRLVQWARSFTYCSQISPFILYGVYCNTGASEFAPEIFGPGLIEKMG